MSLTKYIVIENEVELVNLTGSTNCPECDSVMVVFSNGLHEESECVGCGYTETNQLTTPI